MTIGLNSQVRIRETAEIGFVVAVNKERNAFFFAKKFKGEGVSWHTADELEEMPAGPLRPYLT